MRKIRFFPTDSRWTPPTRATAGAAGFDIHSLDNILLLPDRSVVLSTGTGVVIPKGFVGFIRSRSGMAFKHSVQAFHGTIDSDYRGELRILLMNFGNSAYAIQRGDRIAQLVVSPCYAPSEIALFPPDETERGTAGFGSTGV